MREKQNKRDRQGIQGMQDKQDRQGIQGMQNIQDRQNRLSADTAAGGEEAEAYTVLRSGRRTLALQVTEGGEVRVRAPYRASARQIEAFVGRHRDWIAKQRKRLARLEENTVWYTDAERAVWIERAREQIPKRVSYFAQRMGVDYGRITIREQKTRWGSCSSRGSLNFNWKLMLMPEAVLDYVVVHELAHRREMNHSAAFWSVVQAELPDYRERRKILSEVRIAKAGEQTAEGARSV